MSGFTVVALLLLAIGLYYNYQEDGGQHRKAKIWQAICLALLVQAYASTIKQTVWLIGHWGSVEQRFSTAVGYVPGSLHWLLYLLHLGLALLTLLTAGYMVNRSDTARRRLLWLLPPLVVVEIFSFYRGWLGGGSELPATHFLGLVIGLAVIVPVALVISLVYRSPFMKAFYGKKTAAGSEIVALTS